MITNYKLCSAVSFAAGVAIGALVTWKYVNSKYDLCIRDDYEEEEDDDQAEETISTDSSTKSLNDKPDIMEYAAKIKELGYSESVEEEAEENMKDEPYVISSEEYDDGEYETETLTLYADGVLTDWYDDVIEDVEDVVGLEAIENFDKYAEDGDTVFVRNDARYTDYEIQRDQRNYYDVHPQSMEE